MEYLAETGRNGAELGARDAIIHRRVDKKEEYAVIEWEGDSIKIRSSSTDEVLANAIAIAGLHEIEELLVDEMPSLLPGGAGKGAGANGHNGHASAQGQNGHAQNGNGAKAESQTNRDLLLTRDGR